MPSSPLKRGPVLVHQVESLVQLRCYSLFILCKSPVEIPLAQLLSIVWLAKMAVEKKAPTQVSSFLMRTIAPAVTAIVTQ